MVEIISTDERSLSDAGDSKRISIVKSWLSILGFEDKEDVQTALLYTEKHGFLFGAWCLEDQPDLEDLNEKEIKNVAEKVDILDVED